MPAPSTSVALLRSDLRDSLETFNLAADRQGFIAPRIFPVLEVAKQSGSFGKIPIAQLLKHRETVRAPGAGYSRGSQTFTSDNYACQEYGAEETVDDREKELYADWIVAEQIAAASAQDAVLRAAEKRVSDLLFNATTFAGKTADVTLEWDVAHTATAVPIQDVETAVRTVWANCGLWPNALVINRTVFRNLRNITQIVDRITASGAGQAAKPSDITAAMLAAVFDLDEVIVSDSAKNTADEGQSVSISSLWSSEYALLCRVARTASIKEPCLGRTFHWNADGSQIGGTIESYRAESNRSDVIRCRHDVHEKLLMAECGYLLGNVTTI